MVDSSIIKARLVWLVLCFIWGSTWLFIKLGLADLPPLTFAGIRFLLAAIVLLTIIRLRGLTLPRDRSDWIMLAVTGILSFGFNYGLIFWAEQHISSGLAALLQATTPAFGLVIAHVYLPGERITAEKIVGVLLGIAGVAVIFSNQLTVAGNKALAGSAAVVFSSVCVAYSNVLVKARAKSMDPATLAAGQMVFGLVPLLLIGIPLEGNPFNYHWTGMAVISLLYLTFVGSVLAFILYYWLVRNMEVTKTMLISLVTPVVAVSLGMIVLNEQLTWRMFVGGVMIMSGIGMIVLRRNKASTVGSSVGSGELFDS